MLHTISSKQRPVMSRSFPFNCRQASREVEALSFIALQEFMDVVGTGGNEPEGYLPHTSVCVCVDASQGYCDDGGCWKAAEAEVKIRQSGAVHEGYGRRVSTALPQVVELQLHGRQGGTFAHGSHHQRLRKEARYCEGLSLSMKEGTVWRPRGCP
jgi:hypothetical protein